MEIVEGKLDFCEIEFKSPLADNEGKLQKVAELYHVDASSFYKDAETRACNVKNVEDVVTYVKGFCPDKRPEVYACRTDGDPTLENIRITGFEADNRKWSWRTTVRLVFYDNGDCNDDDSDIEAKEGEAAEGAPEGTSKKKKLERQEVIQTGQMIGPKHVLVPAKLLWKPNIECNVEGNNVPKTWERIKVQYSTQDLEKIALLQYAHVIKAYIPQGYKPNFEIDPNSSDVSQEALAVLILDQPIGTVTGFLNLAIIDPNIVQLEDGGYRTYTATGFPRKTYRLKRLARVRGLDFRLPDERKACTVNCVRFGKTLPALHSEEIRLQLKNDSLVILNWPKLEELRKPYDSTNDAARSRVLEHYVLKQYTKNGRNMTNHDILRRCIQNEEGMYVIIKEGLHAGLELSDIFTLDKENETQIARSFLLTSESEIGDKSHYCGAPLVDQHNHDTKKYQRISENAFYFRWLIDDGEGGLGSPTCTDLLDKSIGGTFCNAIVVKVFKDAKGRDITAALRITEPVFNGIAEILKATW